MRTWSGTYTALITPFEGEHLDEEGLHTLIVRQREAGVDGLVLLGTTGESPTLTPWEKKRILEIAKKAAGPLRLIVGTGVNSTQATCETTTWAAEMGAEAALVISPYYNMPTHEGLLAHFTAIANASPIPLILYNHPGRTGVTLTHRMVAELMEHSNIAAIKEAGTDFTLPSAFPTLSGNDLLTLPMMSVGGQGVISVISNLVPQEMTQLVQAALAGDFARAREIHTSLLPLMRASCVQTNPIPIKAMMDRAGLPAGAPRLPLLPMQPVEVPCASVC